ncbi:MAG TPA: GNAT family N-acetyltransferase [Bryobacteraceae bacterium]|nr:GNAT family N-acetyltransferase [Bryobacteraceae bacterium]
MATAFRFEPVTEKHWKDLAALFGERGACGGCWCMAWRKPRGRLERDRGAANRASLRTLVKKGPPPGVLAYCDDQPIGWCAVAPRQEYVALAKSRVLRPLDDAPVWSVSCFFIAKPYRRQGISVQLLKAAIDFVRTQGGKIVEGYPALPKTAAVSATFSWTGVLGAFLKAGFQEMPRWSASRPIVRYFI